MGRSIKEIYNSIITEKATMPTLSGLLPSSESYDQLLHDSASSSKVAKWRVMAFVMSVAIWSHELLFDKHKAEIEARATQIITGPIMWYRDQCFLFQNGYSMTWNASSNRYEYAHIDDEAKIIKRAAAIEVAGQVRLKVAKLVSGLPAPLSAPELEAFGIYMSRVKFAGTRIAIISRVADLLKIEYDVIYDPLVMTPTGELVSSPGTKPVEIAIHNYIQNLPFNGQLNLTKLTDAIQEATGVVDPVLTSASAKYGDIPYITINRVYTADAGHMIIDPDFPLSTQINYIANV